MLIGKFFNKAAGAITRGISRLANPTKAAFTSARSSYNQSRTIMSNGISAMNKLGNSARGRNMMNNGARPMMRIGRMRMSSPGRIAMAVTPLAALYAAPSLMNLATAPAYGGLSGGFIKSTASLMASSGSFQNKYGSFANTRIMSSVGSTGNLMRQGPNRMSQKNMMLGIKGNVGAI